MHVFSFQGHPFSCAYFKQSRFPFMAANAHVFSFQGHPFSCACFKHSNCPFLAAVWHAVRSRDRAAISVESRCDDVDVTGST